MQKVSHWQFHLARLLGRRHEIELEGQQFVGFNFGSGFYFYWSGRPYRGARRA